MATFRKSSKGEWVVFGTLIEVKPGKVRVEKKGGGVSFVEVASVGRPFSANGQQMVYGYIAPKGEASAPKAAPVKVEHSFDEGNQAEYDLAQQEMDADIMAERKMATQDCGFGGF